MLFAQADQKHETWLSGSDLEAYKLNYFCPVSYAEQTYHSYLKDTEYKHVEVEVQFSIKYNLENDLFGLGGKYYIAYSQHAFWQIYTHSKPFRENIYNPEAFARYDLNVESIPSLKILQIGYEHQSNGNPDTTNTIIDGEPVGNISRGLDTLYTIIGFETGDLHTELKAWVPVTSLSDNPDLMDYIGYTSINMKYFYGRQILSLNARGNLATKKGAVEAAYAYPVGESVNLYFKVFTGYTETMIDYEDYVTKFSIGFSFSQ